MQNLRGAVRQGMRSASKAQCKAQAPKRWKLEIPIVISRHQNTLTRRRTSGFGKTLYNVANGERASGALVVACLFTSDRSNSRLSQLRLDDTRVPESW